MNIVKFGLHAKASLKNPGYNFQEGFWKFKQKIKVDEEFANRFQ